MFVNKFCASSTGVSVPKRDERSDEGWGPKSGARTGVESSDVGGGAALGAREGEGFGARRDPSRDEDVGLGASRDPSRDEDVGFAVGLDVGRRVGIGVGLTVNNLRASRLSGLHPLQPFEKWG